MSATETTESQGELKRVMGPGLLLLFIVGDILGTGIYALTGVVAKEVGGVVWLPFLIAFVVATITAYSYLELVTKYPRAAGAALYTHKAFGIHFLTFVVAFTVVFSVLGCLNLSDSATNAFGSATAAVLALVLVIFTVQTFVAGAIGLGLFKLFFAVVFVAGAAVAFMNKGQASEAAHH